jgi:predicted DNA-binding transcriptional regulator AlpA
MTHRPKCEPLFEKPLHEPTGDLAAEVGKTPAVLVNDSFLSAPAVRARYNVTSMTIYRWIADPTLEFPRPYYLGRFRYWRIAELEAWEACRPRVSALKSLAASECLI